MKTNFRGRSTMRISANINFKKALKFFKTDFHSISKGSLHNFPFFSNISELINFYSLKSSENHSFSDDFMRNRNYLLYKVLSISEPNFGDNPLTLGLKKVYHIHQKLWWSFVPPPHPSVNFVTQNDHFRQG